MAVKHIANPIPDDEWKCPACGSRDEFYIDKSADCGDQNCDKSHAQDIVVCYACHGEWTLQTIINKWAKKKNMVKCPCCNGAGWVEGPKQSH